MNPSAPKTRALRSAYGELLVVAGRIRDGDVGTARYATVRAWAESKLRQERRELLGKGLDEELVNDAQLPVVGLLDESAKNSPAREFGEQWAPLQFSLYGHMEAGTKVFQRLEALRQDPRTPIELLELYARCLAWAFQGHYSTDNRLDDLRALREGLSVELAHRLPHPSPLAAQFAPLAVLPMGPRVLGPRWIVSIALLLVALSWLGLTLTLWVLSRNVGAELSHVEALQ